MREDSRRRAHHHPNYSIKIRLARDPPQADTNGSIFRYIMVREQGRWRDRPIHPGLFQAAAGRSAFRNAGTGGAHSMPYPSYLNIDEYSAIRQNGCVPLAWLAALRDAQPLDTE